ncbi:MAG: DUF58 domain-containing protein [Acidimicrobiales bacterium]|nr:DUF58 domain-containing protein [Acidimicrobiales bacterium]
MRPTRASFALIAAGLAMAFVGRALGTLEMYLLAAMAGFAVIIAVLYTASVQLDLEISRRASPTKLRAGQPARIDLEIRNASRRSTPVLRVTDHVSGSSGAKVSLAGIRGRSRSVVAYQLPTRTRGLLEVGPLDLAFGDPMALTRSRVRASAATQLLVHANLLPFVSLRGRMGHEQVGELSNDRSLRSGGDEFFALRPYVVGDELRRVNWRATARTDELMVRTDERPRTGRTTVLFDKRASVYSVEGFERAVSAALSALIAGWTSEDSLRLVTTEPTLVTEVQTLHELDLIDDQFATLRWSTTAEENSGQSSLLLNLRDLGRKSRGGTLIVVTGAPEDNLAAALVGLRRRFERVATITCEPSPITGIRGHVRHDGLHDPLPEWRAAFSGSTADIETAARGDREVPA